MTHTASVTLPAPPPEIHHEFDRESVETLIDEMVEQSFPASDPPAWGVINARLGQALEGSR